jgi:ferredoxin-nitrite reductase
MAMNAPNGFSANEFSKEQQAYLQGLMLGSDVARKVHRLPVLSGSGLGLMPNLSSSGPPAAGLAAGGAAAGAAPAAAASHLSSRHAQGLQRAAATGKPLPAEEKAKRDKDALELWSEIGERAARGEFPRGTDVFLTKTHGLFYVAPAQNAFMCRLRIAGGVLRADQLSGLARLAEEFAGGSVDITTRANLQLREISPQHTLDLLMGLRDIGIVTLGSGADNVRNVTASPLSGIDPYELAETLPLARQLHYHLLHRRELYGLPRKFNIAFDGCGTISSLAETNDVSWHAVEVTQEHANPDLPSGVYFALGLGGITGHGDFARPTHVLAKASECVEISEAILRVFIAHGDRTDRKRARLKYLLDAWGFEKFLAEVEKELGHPLRRAASVTVSSSDRVDRWAHVGVHRQKQAELCYVGVVVPTGRLSSQQLRGLSTIATRHGSGQVRLTVWQNLLIPDIRQGDIAQVQAQLQALGLDWRATSFDAGLVACTGNAGCKFAGSDTKRHALVIAEYLKSRFQLDQPINIHVTGCHHSCAQHAIGDIGLIATAVPADDQSDELVEGYHILVGGATGHAARIGRVLFESVAFEDALPKLARIIATYLEHRINTQSFAEFSSHFDWQAHVHFTAPDPESSQRSASTRLVGEVA